MLTFFFSVQITVFCYLLVSTDPTRFLSTETIRPLSSAVAATTRLLEGRSRRRSRISPLREENPTRITPKLDRFDGIGSTRMYGAHGARAAAVLAREGASGSQLPLVGLLSQDTLRDLAAGEYRMTLMWLVLRHRLHCTYPAQSKIMLASMGWLPASGPVATTASGGMAVKTLCASSALKAQREYARGHDDYAEYTRCCSPAVRHLGQISCSVTTLFGGNGEGKAAASFESVSLVQRWYNAILSISNRTSKLYLFGGIISSKNSNPSAPLYPVSL